MAVFRRCDRCGYEAEQGLLAKIFDPLTWRQIDIGFACHDLCPKCVKALVDWIGTGEPS